MRIILNAIEGGAVGFLLFALGVEPVSVLFWSVLILNAVVFNVLLAAAFGDE